MFFIESLMKSKNKNSSENENENEKQFREQKLSPFPILFFRQNSVQNGLKIGERNILTSQKELFS